MASRFWVGGTGTWAASGSSTGNHWATSTGGAGADANAPVTGDSVTFDGSSGGGTVTVDSTVNGLSLLSITAGAFTGTLDFSVNNPSMTITAAAAATGISFSGSGVGRIFKLGSGTFTFANGAGYDFGTTTGAGTQSLASCTLVFNAGSSPALVGQQQVLLGGFAYGTITFNGRGSGQGVNFSGSVNGWTATTLNLNGPLFVGLGTPNGTITNLNISGSVSQTVTMYITPQNTQITLTVTTATISYAALRNINFTNAATATNSWDLGANTNLTATPPSAGGGSGVIGS